MSNLITDRPGEGPRPSDGMALVARWTGIGALVAALVAGPLAFGAGEAWAWGGLWALSALAALAALWAWMAEGRATFVFAPVFFLAALVAGIGALQMIPLPPGAFALLGPRTRDAYATLFAGASHGASVAPGETLQAVIKATTVLMAVFATLALGRTRGMLLALAAAAGFAALASAGVGIVQKEGQSDPIYGLRDLAQGAEERYWRSSALDPALSSGVGRVDAVSAPGDALFFRRSVNVGDVFGPYPNSNHFGGLMAIVLPVLLAMVLALWRTRRSTWGEEGGFTGSFEGNVFLLLLFALAVGTGAAVYSRSMGAVGGLAAGYALAVGLTLAARRAGKGVAVLAMLAAATAVAGAATYRAELSSVASAKAGERAAVWQAAWGIARNFPAAGSGLGTYAEIAPRYESTELKFLHAHNDYAQFAAEAGFPAAMLAGALVLWQFARLARGGLKRDMPYCSALSAGVAGTFAAMAFHSLFDYNLRVPANALTLAVLAAAGTVGAAAYRTDIETIYFQERRIFGGRITLAALFFIGMAVVAAGAFTTGATVYAQVTSQRAREFLSRTDQASPMAAPEGLSEISAQARTAAQLAPLDAGLRYQRGRLLWMAASFEQDSDRADNLRRMAREHVEEAAALSPAFSYYALSAGSIGGGRQRLAIEWPMQSFAFRQAIARAHLAAGRDGEALDEMRHAIALAVTDPAYVDEDINSAIAELLSHFGSYREIRSAAPDTFGGHLLFGRGLAAAGVLDAALEEYVLAAAAGADTGRSAGLSERSAAALAERLVHYGRLDDAGRFYVAVLARRGDWQFLRLSYAQYLLRQGLREEASAEVETILAARVPEWLAERATALGRSMR